MPAIEENAVNQASQDAIAAGLIHEESQLNQADAGFIDRKGRERAPFDRHATPDGSVPNAADVQEAQRRRDAGESDKTIADAMNVRPDVVAAWLGDSSDDGDKKPKARKAKK